MQYLQMGLFHILDIGGLDHLLFIGSLVLIYTFSDWKRVLVLLTAFTIGHGIALIVIASDVVDISSVWVERLIPITILITAVYHLFAAKMRSKVIYYLTLVFGLIHGCAFAQGWNKLFGFSADYLLATIGFNIGVELGQLLFALLVMSLVFISTRVFNIGVEKVRIFIFAIILTLAVQYLLEAF